MFDYRGEWIVEGLLQLPGGSVLSPHGSLPVCTHSHPIGIPGAVLHSLALARALSSGCCPSPSDLMETVDIAATLPRLIREDTEIGNYWLSAFQREVGSLDEAWSQAVGESKEAIGAVAKTEKNGMP